MLSKGVFQGDPRVSPRVTQPQTLTNCPIFSNSEIFSAREIFFFGKNCPVEFSAGISLPHTAGASSLRVKVRGEEKPKGR